ncbi:MAG: GWxTD domain-containing protein [Acidobacteriota bacterium]|nr:GWxTD domain-containing protein [Acidobacteriota bacterium]
MKNIKGLVLMLVPVAACFAQAPQSAKQVRKQEARLRKELEPAYKKWREEDVAYIITDDEKQAFNRLSTDEEREQFVEQFWLRRDPTPDTAENEYKEEHYRRIAYANERFASGVPGWKTDRGRIYITFGPPDEVEPHPSGGGGQSTTYPFEMWRYRYIEGIGNNVEIEFVDRTLTGEYRMTMDPDEKNALSHVATTGNRPQPPRGSADFFERQRVFAGLQKAPAVRFTDLEATVNSTLRYNALPMMVRADYLRITDATVLSNVTLQFDRKDLQFQLKDAVSTATVNIYVRITSLSRRVVNVFEDVVTVEGLGSPIYQKSLPLPPGTYRLNIVAKDLVGGNMGTQELVLEVPRFAEERLASSSLILADLIEKVPTTNIGTGQFVIGDTKK